MNQYVIQMAGTGELYGPFSSYASAKEWSKKLGSKGFTILPLIYPV
jgi:hypothetical protein